MLEMRRAQRMLQRKLLLLPSSHAPWPMMKGTTVRSIWVSTERIVCPDRPRENTDASCYQGAAYQSEVYGIVIPRLVHRSCLAQIENVSVRTCSIGSRFVRQIVIRPMTLSSGVWVRILFLPPTSSLLLVFFSNTALQAQHVNTRERRQQQYRPQTDFQHDRQERATIARSL